MDILNMPGTTLDLMYDLLPSLRHLSDTQKERIVIEGRYKPFLKRQAAEVAALKRDEDLKLDINLDYNMYVGGGEILFYLTIWLNMR